MSNEADEENEVVMYGVGEQDTRTPRYGGNRGREIER